MSIPKLIFRTVPEVTTAEVDAFWEHTKELHRGWQFVEYREPVDADWFPLSAPSWGRCQSGAQKAGLIRLEALLGHGGTYLDSDMRMLAPLDPLLGCEAFAAWEDPNVVPDAVLGARPGHPAIRACLEHALERINSESTDWRTGNGAWSTGPGVTTTVLPNRPDVLLLPPSSFYAVHYSRKDTIPTHLLEPWNIGVHYWAASWLTSP